MLKIRTRDVSRSVSITGLVVLVHNATFWVFRLLINGFRFRFMSLTIADSDFCHSNSDEITL